MRQELANRRLYAQQIVRHECATPADLVAWLGAVQAQDYGAAKWALGLRLAPGVTDATIERTLTEGAILRTHALRWTWQLVTPKDLRWILPLVAPRLIDRSATRNRQLGLDAATFRRSRSAIQRALRDGGHLTRSEVSRALSGAGVKTDGQRLSHLLARAELEGLICSGARRGKQCTHALLDLRSPGIPPALSRGDAVAKLARRYFRSRGPATVADFAWWSGLPASEARSGLEAVQPTLISETIGGCVYWRQDGPSPRAQSSIAHLLPAFDEYLIAYRSRDAVLDPRHAKRINKGGGMLGPFVLLDGEVIGTWRRVAGRSAVRVEIDLFLPKARVHPAIQTAAGRYGAFLGVEAALGRLSRARGREPSPRPRTG